MSNSTPFFRTRSAAAAAQLLELWTQGRCVLDQNEVEFYLHILSSLDMAVADMYDRLFVNESRKVSRET